MAIKLTNTNIIPQYVNLLVYGEAGSGKTTLCGTASDTLIISAEGGLLALAVCFAHFPETWSEKKRCSLKSPSYIGLLPNV